MSKSPTLRYERSLKSSGHRLVAGCDEVGRGSLAGPVSVGMVVVDVTAVRALKGVRDSKLLTVADREALVPRIRRWAVSYGVGHAGPQEIDDVGLMVALRRAGNRAWAALQLHARPDAVVLDGNHDWLSAKDQAALFESLADPDGVAGGMTDADDGGFRGDVGAVGDLSDAADVGDVLPGAECTAPVYTKIKADMQCLSVAAASVLAKVERDAHMAELATAYPQYGWEMNKGYATPAHRKALNEYGPAMVHRRSWNLMAPQVEETSDEMAVEL
ncbi:ribonuclease HII [Arthrobacter castelli]|uniref:ribonuclease HII n=1 Tax=Arthrobacter castelli TaxID=271431 RepID=UPI00040D146E|nr:ribonuclease HII [Arthrobacter castelli]